MGKSFKSQFKMIARSVGYRMGKASAERERYRTKDEWMPNFDELFAPEFVPEAEAGYGEGQEFMRAKFDGRYVDTFRQGGI